MYSSIPAKLKNYFWEFNPEQLDLVHHSQLIIERILEKGNLEALQVLHTIYSQEQLQLALAAAVNLRPATRNLWNAVLQ